MEIFENTFRNLLIAANLVSTRVFLLRAPQAPAPKATTPYIVFFPTGPTPLHAHSGPARIRFGSYQVSIFDPSQQKALAIADSMREYLDGWKGIFETYDFGAIFFRTQTQTWETDTQLTHVIQEFEIEFKLLPNGTRSTNPQFQPAVKE